MGFGSYDESEQETQELDTSDEETQAVNVHESDHDGDVSFEADLSTDELVNKLDDMKDSEDED